MKQQAKKFVTLALATALLSGCQSFPLTAWMFKHSDRPDARPAPALAAAQILQQGREQLRVGHVSAAVASFRMARLDPATRADADNGLAVAYVYLGRLDLADRYFRAALALQPDNDRFAANLLRLRHTVMLAQREREVSQPAPAAVPSDSSQLASAAGGPINRDETVVHIVTRKYLGQAPRIDVASARTHAKARRTQVKLAEQSHRKAAGRPAPTEIVFDK